MNRRSEKGYTGVEIAISVVVLFIFISVIASLSYSFNSSAKEIELKAEGVAIAVQEIENLKNTLCFEQIANRSRNNNSLYVDNQEIKTGFFETVKIEDYADFNSSKITGLVKKVTLQIKYMFKGKEQSIELSTIFSKES